ncbi:MAG TPA: choice-of-anchor Q domain-containing protein [Puia sp.]|jgi:hypothetical protein|nr:choice-of-anchor Q domain-containing protein [Puia sp.]
MKGVLPVIILAVMLVSSCTKNSFITSKDAGVTFSADTVFFDTVFVTAGSVTQFVKIVNPNSQKLHLTDVRLMGGAQSYFAINIDGSPGPEVDNIDLDAGDSLYIFVAVRIDPNSANLPFIVQDSIQVAFNGNQQYIQLQAWGQNAHFLRNQVLTGSTVWSPTLPYVIQGGLQIDTGATLTIPAGCRVYFHADAPLLVDGSLRVEGADSGGRVLFMGDRLDAPYNGYPGSWPGIYFRGASTGNLLQYAVVENADEAVVVSAPPTGTVAKVVLQQCIVDNSYDAGILGLDGSIQAVNCLISNCGQNVVLGGGGYYNFSQCTSAAFSNLYIVHTQPVLAVSDEIADGAAIFTGAVQANFVNCIFWGNYGNVADEVVVTQQTSNAFSVGFSNCLWKVQAAPSGVTATNMIVNQDPLFDSVNTGAGYYNFRLKANSPAIGAGAAGGVMVDLDGNPRPAVGPDLGCYQRQ